MSKETESLEHLEQRFQQSVKEVEASLKQRSDIIQPIAEQKAQLASILHTLSKLHTEFFEQISTVVTDTTLENEQLHAKLAGTHVAEGLLTHLEARRKEDLASMIRYLDNLSKQVAAMVTANAAELQRQATQRDEEQQVLDMIKKVLKNYV